IRCSRNERRMDEINSRPFARDAFRFRSWNDEHMFVRGRALNVRDLFMHIAFHSAAQWRIELRQVAKLQRFSIDNRQSANASLASLNIALLPWPQRSRLQRR